MEKKIDYAEAAREVLREMGFDLPENSEHIKIVVDDE